MLKYLIFFLVSVRKPLKSVSKYLKSLVCNEKLVLCLLKLTIAFQPLQVVLTHTSLVGGGNRALCELFYFV